MADERDRIKEAFEQKDWNQIKTNDSWAVFKIMSEFVEGYERMAKIGPCVSIFGSARTKDDNPYYLLAEEIAFKLTQNGYGVINIYRYNDTDIINCDFNFNCYIAGDQRNMIGTAYYDNSAAISTISFFTGSTFSAGTAYIYGVA